MIPNIELLAANDLETTRIGRSSQEHSHLCYQMYYVLQGDPVYEVSGKTFSVQPSSFFFIPPYTPHKMLPLAEAECHIYELKLIIHNDYIRSHLPSSPVSLTDSCMIKKMLHYVINNWRNKSEDNADTIDHMMCAILSCFFIDGINFDNCDSAYIDTSSYSKITQSIIAYIESYYHMPFSMQSMAEHLNYHPNYLSSVFSKDTGISVVNYLNLIRIRRAVVFFAFYNQDAFSTAESVGFTNISHFSRVFKSLVGISPREFKNAFSTLDRESVTQYFLNEPSLNFRICSLDEAFLSLKNIGSAVSNILSQPK